MKITHQERAQISKLEVSPSITNLSESILRSLDEDTISRLTSAFLYLTSNAHPYSDFAKFISKKELWGTLSLGLNVMGAVLPAMLFDKEFRVLALKAGMTKGSEVGGKYMAVNFDESNE